MEPPNKNYLNLDGSLTCRMCGEAKSTANYHRNKVNATGYERVCKPCAAEKARTWRLNNKQSRTTPSAEQNAIRRARRKGYTEKTDLLPGWRMALFEFYQNACLKCGSREMLHADHVIPLSVGGPHIASNMQVLCRHCNLAKHAKIADYRKGMIFKQKTPTQ